MASQPGGVVAGILPVDADYAAWDAEPMPPRCRQRRRPFDRCPDRRRPLDQSFVAAPRADRRRHRIAVLPPRRRHDHRQRVVVRRRLRRQQRAGRSVGPRLRAVRRSVRNHSRHRRERTRAVRAGARRGTPRRDQGRHRQGARHLRAASAVSSIRQRRVRHSSPDTTSSPTERRASPGRSTDDGIHHHVTDQRDLEHGAAHRTHSSPPIPTSHRSTRTSTTTAPCPPTRTRKAPRTICSPSATCRPTIDSPQVSCSQHGLSRRAERLRHRVRRVRRLRRLGTGVLRHAARSGSATPASATATPNSSRTPSG